jgi:hypothetical protein
MRNKWMVIFTVFLILLAMATPVLAAPGNQGYEGRPTGYSNSPGYYIWQDGETWYLEVTNTGKERQFTGSIRTDGKFVQVKALAAEQNDRMRVDNEQNKISFRFRTEREKDGLSFAVLDGDRLDIALFIDGQPVEPSRIRLGRQNQNPSSNSFQINLRDNSYGLGNRVNYTGRPTMLHPGNAMGYFIWQDGDRWYVESTTNGKVQNFSGVIETNGKFSDIQAVKTKRDDRDGQSFLERIADLLGRNRDRNNDRFTIDSNNKRINFSFKTVDEADGLAFTLREGAFIKFTLDVDGILMDSSRIYLGKQNRNPTDNPFRIAIGDSGYGQDGQSSDSRYKGRPVSFDPGKDLGYYIWHENGYWNLQSTTRGRNRTFSGVIKSRRNIMNVVAVRTDRQDSIRLSDDKNTIRFNYQTAGGEEGFRFRAYEGEPIDFELYIDGQPVDRSLIHLGRNSVHPASHSFRLE